MDVGIITGAAQKTRTAAYLGDALGLYGVAQATMPHIGTRRLRTKRLQ